MRLNKAFRRGLLVERNLTKLLLEEDDLFGSEGGDEEGGDEEGGGEEGGGEEGGEEKKEDAAEEKPKAPPIKPGDKVELEKQFDAKLDTMLQDFEAAALKSASINTADVAMENWWRAPVGKLLFESGQEYTESDFDIQKFASDVARLMMNYDALLDMESIIFNKAKSFLKTKYGDDVADSLSEILATRYGLDLEGVKEETPAPLAIGARGGGAAG